jgi:hypothetical protein
VCGDENEDPGNRIDGRLMCRDVGFGRWQWRWGFSGYSWFTGGRTTESVERGQCVAEG